jgi:hypothetical protein
LIARYPNATSRPSGSFTINSLRSGAQGHTSLALKGALAGRAPGAVLRRARVAVTLLAQVILVPAAAVIALIAGQI